MNAYIYTTLSTKVDEYSQTNVSSVYAIGDVTDRINLTPVALHEGMMLAKTLFGGEPTKADHKNVSASTYTFDWIPFWFSVHFNLFSSIQLNSFLLSN